MARTKHSVKIEHSTYGELEDVAVERFVLANNAGMRVAILSWGAIIQELHVPDARGNTANVTLGFDNLAQYGKKHPHFGSVIGRFANRIGGSRFTLDGVVYQLTPNKGTFTAHGGARPFDLYHWKAKVVDTDHGPGVSLMHVSPDGDEGFPGELTAEVIYSLTPEQGLRHDHDDEADGAQPDQPRLLQPRRRGIGHRRGSSGHRLCQPLHADDGRADHDRGDRAGRGHRAGSAPADADRRRGAGRE
jgi:aldose 1-epimerase